jgi:LytS/YehU family sensor histidine kinase
VTTVGVARVTERLTTAVGDVGGNTEVLIAVSSFMVVALATLLLWCITRARRRVADLEARLARAERRASTSLLAPHFLLNTLNAVTGVVRDDAQAAERMLCTMGDLLRSALRHDGTHVVPLRDELELAHAYLTLMSLRWRDTPRIEVDVPPETLDALVPALLLQPLLENALRHGSAPGMPARVEIRARRDPALLTVQVCDEGPGLRTDDAGSVVEGIGLAATRARLAAIFGDAHRVELRNRSPRGVVASVAIPYRPARGGSGPMDLGRGRDADSDAHRRRRADCA